MAFNVNELRKASLIPFSRPVASPAYFEAYFNTIPNVLMNESPLGGSIPSPFKTIVKNVIETVRSKIFGPGPATNVRFRVQAADLPQRQLEVQSRFTNGPQRLVPFGSIYATTTIDVIESDQYDMRKFFDEWMDAIAGTRTSGMNRYKVAYYDDIVADFVLVAFAANGLPQAKWTLKEVYPIAVNATQMNWASVDQYVTIPVELAYHEWEFKELDLTDILSDPAYADAAVRGAISGAISTIF